jgi:indole-3-pyruvate monooxygenase
MHANDVLVVGAGPAGLAASACLRQRGVPHQHIEREAHLAASWRRHYDRLHLHTAKQFSTLPLSSWPAGSPRYPSRDQVLAYLASYAAQHHISPRFGIEVQRIDTAGSRLQVHTQAGLLEPRCVVVATGYNGAVNRPPLPGLAHFAGPVMHSSDYKNPAQFSGQRTLVIGCGNSGAEIALDLAEQGVDVSMVVRGPVHVVPRDLFGRPTQQSGILLSALPLGLRDAIVGNVMRLAVGDLSAWGIQRPSLGINRMIEERGRIPMLDIGTIAMIKSGRIRVVPGVEELLRDHVRFAGGQTLPFDAIILATGYTPGLSRWIDGFDKVSDARGRPDRFGAESQLGGLYFVGFKNPATGALREIALEAPRVAAAIQAKLQA